MNALELTDNDDTVIDIDRVEAISKKPKTNRNYIQIWFRNRERVLEVYYDSRTQAMVDHGRIVDKMTGRD